jgi:glycerophosphoryl diester phosphodiesterase
MNRRYVVFVLLLVMLSCSKNDITVPPYNPEVNLENTLQIPDSVMKHMEGIYNLSNGSGKLGSHFVCKATRNRVSFFSETDGIFMILKFGFNPTDSSIQFAGFWRYSENNRQGNIGFSITKEQGALDLLLNGTADSLELNGIFLDDEYYTRALSLKFGRHFSAYVQSHEFAIFAHHGIQTTANPPYAENSLNVVRNAESYGVTGIEFDVRMTKDHVPICIHDPTINTRLTLKGPLSGGYDQYNFSLLSNYVRLEDGQSIPSVEQVLDVFIESTKMKYVWLDVKGNPDIFIYLEPVIRNAYAKAAALNRDVVFITDLPTHDVIDEYKKQQASYETPPKLPVMCELTLQDVIDNRCEYWGPRYSEGTMLADVDRAHSMGIKVYSWTLNDRNIILNYLQNGRFDGFISDYPAYIVYYYNTLF